MLIICGIKYGFLAFVLNLQKILSLHWFTIRLFSKCGNLIKLHLSGIKTNVPNRKLEFKNKIEGGSNIW